MKTIGVGASDLASSCCRSRPLMPGRRTSSTRQWARSRSGLARNSGAEENVCALSPAEPKRSLRLSRMDASSSTTKIHESFCSFTAQPSSRVRNLFANKAALRSHESLRAASMATSSSSSRNGLYKKAKAPALQLEAAHARHSDVENQACRIARLTRAQKSLRRREPQRSKAERLNQIGERGPESVVVIDDGDSGHARHEASLSSLPGKKLRNTLHLEETLSSAGENFY